MRSFQEIIADASRAEMELSAAKARDWNLDMSTAPMDGTVIEVVGRYVGFDAGFPRYAAFRDGEWFDCNCHGNDRIIPWAWRPRDSWPMEPKT